MWEKMKNEEVKGGKSSHPIRTGTGHSDARDVRHLQRHVFPFPSFPPSLSCHGKHSDNRWQEIHQKQGVRKTKTALLQFS